MAQKNTIYTVHAYRWGEREDHSYPVGVYTKKYLAISAAKAEENWRGGKYECEVYEWIVDSKNKDDSHFMPHKTIKSI